MRFVLGALLSALPFAVLLAQPFYTGAYGGSPHCQACHSSATPPTNQFSYWNATAHGSAYDSHPELQWNPDCLPCHTTGWNLSLANHGFDDYFFSGDTLGMMQRRNVQCESCHGPTDQVPHLATTVVDYHAEVCRNCHSGIPARNTYEEWASCGHGDVASPAAQQLACAKCHEALSANTYLSTGTPPGSLPQNPIWQVTCVACHATHTRNAFTAQTYLPGDSLCRTCHTMEGAVVGEEPHATQKEMVLGPGFGAFEWPGFVYNNSCHETYLPEPCTICHMYPNAYGNPDTTTSGHQVSPVIQTCALAGCHQTQIPPDSSFNINGCQAMVDSLLVALTEVLAQADTSNPRFTQAKFDYDFVNNDGSRGVHNFYYGRDLLESSIAGLQGHPSVSTELMAMCPITVPASGGSFDYDVMVHNHMSSDQTFSAWIMMRLPTGVWQGPMVGPIRLTLPGMALLSRSRTQFITGTMPNGMYTYRGYVGEYPNAKWDSSSFMFRKGMCADGSDGGEFQINGGESGFTPDGAFGCSASPNPFNPTTSLNFTLPAAGWVKLSVFDITGRPLGKSSLLNSWIEAGNHAVVFDGSDLTSGIYLYRLQAGEWAATGKLVLLK